MAPFLPGGLPVWVLSAGRSYEAAFLKPASLTAAPASLAKGILMLPGAGVQGSPCSPGVSMGLDLIVHFESPGTGFIIFRRGYQTLEVRAMQEINNRQIY